MKRILFTWAVLFGSLVVVSGQQGGGIQGYPGVATSVSSSAFPLLAPDGSVSAPSYGFSADTTTGIFRRGGGIISFSSLGTDTVEVNTPAFVLVNSTNLNTSNSQSLGNILIGGASPAISSGFGTSPSVPNGNSTAAFTVNVGTGGTASSGVVALNRTAAAGWACNVFDITALAANTGDRRTVQTASSTTTVTVQNQVISTGAASAWTASDILRFNCFGY